MGVYLASSLGLWQTVLMFLPMSSDEYMYFSWIFLAVELPGPSVYICSVLVDTNPKVSHYGYTNSYSQQQCFRVLIAPPALSIICPFNFRNSVGFYNIVWHFRNRTIPLAPKPETLNCDIFLFFFFFVRNALYTKSGDSIRRTGPFPVVGI